jgi:hypothetical protein
MADDETVTDHHTLSRKQASTELLRNRIIELRSQGRRTKEIAVELSISRETVSRHLNSSDVKQIIQSGRDRLINLVHDALDVYSSCLDGDDTDRTNARAAAKDVLESLGIIRKDVNLNHNFPKPTVIKRADGTQIVLGTTVDIEGDGAA